MFDVGFWEIMFILVIALLVVGPERLPRLARTTGLWLGKIRGFVHSVKADIDRELAAEELKRTLARQAAVPELKEIIEDSKKATDDSAGSRDNRDPSGKPAGRDHDDAGNEAVNDQTR
jgi:sec-independent protein translocase protein TatB